MRFGLDTEWYFLLASCFFSGLFGWTLGYFWPGLVVGLVLYIAYNRWQAHRFAAWLVYSGTELQTDMPGYWMALAQQVSLLQRAEKRRQEALRKQLKRMISVTYALEDGVLLLEGDLTLDWWNTAAGKIMNLSSRDRGSPLLNLMRMPDFVRYIQKTSYDTSIDLASPYQENKVLRIKAVRLRKGKKARVGLQITDITRLVALETMRKDFVANASHELKTPLTVIKGYLETLPQLVPNTSKLSAVLEALQNQTLRIQHLADDLLFLAEMETGTEMPLKVVDVDALLRRIVQDSSALATDKHPLILKVKRHFTLSGNEKELYSAFSNLVVNAIRHNPEGATIVIKANRNANHFRVSVSDDGVGIDPQYIPRLTERFFRVDPGRNSSTGGTGLGLSITKHVLQRHNGTLEIYSDIGKGAEFRCVFLNSV